MHRGAVLLGVILCASTPQAAEVNFTLTVEEKVIDIAMAVPP